MHITFFNRSYWPDQAATGQLLTDLAEDLVREYGCQVSVVAGLPLLKKQEQTTSYRGWSPVRRESHNGVTIFRAAGTTLRPRRFVARATNYVSYFLSAALAGLRVGRPDVVVSLTDPPIIGLVGLLMARRAGAKFVFLCQDIFPEVAVLLEDFHNQTVNRGLQRINQFLVRHADRVIALGDTMKERLVTGKGADPQKVTVIHNWADCSAIVPGPKQNIFTATHGFSDAFVVMHSGNIGLSQGLDTLIDAAALLRPHRDLVIAIVGDGNKRAALERRVREQQLTNVRFFPYQPKETLHESFAAADIFIVSLMRGLAGYIVPSKLYGILAAGRPYVAAVEEECEVAAITKAYDCGFVAEPGNAQDLANKIVMLYQNRDVTNRFGNNARYAGLMFDRSRQVRAYYDLFQELTDNASAHELSDRDYRNAASNEQGR
jgi:colanic acid biosynthesis glycosyl transferase WcaI